MPSAGGTAPAASAGSAGCANGDVIGGMGTAADPPLCCRAGGGGEELRCDGCG
jgi:hypothetical protein